MDNTEYKIKKQDKLTRDIVQAVNKVASFGFGDNVDLVAKQSLTSFLLSLVTISELRQNDTEILTQSILDELVILAQEVVARIDEVKSIQE